MNVFDVRHCFQLMVALPTRPRPAATASTTARPSSRRRLPTGRPPPPSTASWPTSSWLTTPASTWWCCSTPTPSPSFAPPRSWPSTTGSKSSAKWEQKLSPSLWTAPTRHSHGRTFPGHRWDMQQHIRNIYFVKRLCPKVICLPLGYIRASRGTSVENSSLITVN